MKERAQVHDCHCRLERWYASMSPIYGRGRWWDRDSRQITLAAAIKQSRRYSYHRRFMPRHDILLHRKHCEL